MNPGDQIPALRHDGMEVLGEDRFNIDRLQNSGLT